MATVINYPPTETNERRRKKKGSILNEDISVKGGRGEGKKKERAHV